MVGLVPRLSGREGGGERFRELAWGRGGGEVCVWLEPLASSPGSQGGRGRGEI